MNAALINLVANLFGPFNGYKSYIGGAMIGVAAAIRAVAPQYESLADTLQTLGVALLGVGIAHKVEKMSTGDPPAMA